MHSLYIFRRFFRRYYRDKDSNEIDLVIESDGELHPLEIKKTANPGTDLVGAFVLVSLNTK